MPIMSDFLNKLLVGEDGLSFARDLEIHRIWTYDNSIKFVEDRMGNTISAYWKNDPSYLRIKTKEVISFINKNITRGIL